MILCLNSHLQSSVKNKHIKALFAAWFDVYHVEMNEQARHTPDIDQDSNDISMAVHL